MALIDRFVAERSNEISYAGKQVYAAYKLSNVPVGGSIKIRWIAARSTPVQGLQLHVRSGLLTCAGFSGKHLVLWRDSAPSQLEVHIQGPPRTQNVDVVLRNTWRTSTGEAKSSLGNAGIVAEGDDADLLLRCSDGEGDPQFDDLVVAITVLRSSSR